MIVVYKENGWEIITQRNHGILAAQIGLHWKFTGRPARWCEIILAIGEHDDVEMELSGENLLTETGGPLDFSMKSFNLDKCQLLARLTITKSRYIALLTSLHMEFLYRKQAKTDAIAASFLKDQKKLRLTLGKELNISEKECERIYGLIEWCDAFSLLLCKGDIQPEHRIIEIGTGPDKQAYNVFQVDEGILSVEPWPFDVDRFLVSYEKRSFAKLKFKSSADFRSEFMKAPVKEAVWELRKSKRYKHAKIK